MLESVREANSDSIVADENDIKVFNESVEITDGDSHTNTRKEGSNENETSSLPARVDGHIPRSVVELTLKDDTS